MSRCLAVIAFLGQLGAVILAGLILSATSWAQPLTLTSNVPPPMSRPNGQGCLDRVLSEAFATVGKSIEIHYLPGGRGTENANRGIDDGTFVRIWTTGNRFKNLVGVPVPLWESEFVAISNSLEFNPQGWASLAPYTVGFPRTWRVFEKNVTGAKKIVRVSRPQQLVPLLDSGRIEIALLSRGLALRLFRAKAESVTIHEPSFASQKLFLFLHRRHAPMVPHLSSALRKISEKPLRAKHRLQERDAPAIRFQIAREAEEDNFRPVWFTVFTHDENMLRRFRERFPRTFTPCTGT